jgi:TonB family protein
MSMHEEIQRLRAADRRDAYLATAAAALIHYVLLAFVHLPESPPRIFDVRPPENLVVLHRYSPPAAGPRPEAAPLPAERPGAADVPPPSAAGDGGLEDGPVRIGQDGIAPRAVELVKPQYPESARRARVRGIVSLDVVIHKDGSVGEITVRSGLGTSGCNEAAIQAVQRSRFEAGILRGRPVDAILTIDFRFQ